MKTIKVTLREKTITNNRFALYLDFYPAITSPETGKLTRREFLGIYIHQNPKTVLEKQHNKDQKQFAEQIRQKRLNEVNKPEVYNDHEKEIIKLNEKSEVDFIAYFSKKYIDNKTFSRKTVYHALLAHFKTYFGDKLRFSQLNETVCNEFKEFLSTVKGHNTKSETISNNTLNTYIKGFKASLTAGFNDGFLKKNLSKSLKNVTIEETHRNYLTIEEINLLIKTDCKNDVLKRAALFSALTGLRHSDIKKLVWSEIEVNEGRYFLKFRQQKTKGAEYFPINKQAFELLGERKGDKDQVFEGFKYATQNNLDLAIWVKNACITKKITFHCFRHSFATTLLTKDVDLYTVSKMLGHKDLKTTQIYAKIIDKKKEEAVDLLNFDF